MLRDALMALTAEQGYEAVTVSAIAERAMINRATFYRYYEDKEDLLLRGLDELYDSLADSAPQKPLASDAPQDAPQGSSTAPNALLASLSFIQAHMRFYQRMLGTDGDPKFIGRMREYHRSIIAPRVALFLNTELGQGSGIGHAERELTVDTAVGAFEGTIQGWLDRDCRDDVQTVAGRCIAGVAAVLRSSY